MMEFTGSNSVFEPWMRRALQLAALADGLTSPNPLVGAVVLNGQGKLVGEGFHLRAGESHAEVDALKQAGNNAKDGTLIVTLEPCCHHGKTPPCTDLILSSGVKKVVVALEDPDPRVSGKGISRLRAAGIEVFTGLLEEEAAFQNRAFIFRIRNGRPWGVLKWAMSLDGRTGLPNGQSKWISGNESRKWVYKLRSKCDAVIVGSGTVRSDDPLLTSRGLSRPEPLRVVLSKSLRLPFNAQLWNTSLAKTLIAYGPDALKENLEEFPKGLSFLPLNSTSPIELLPALAKRDCNRVLWECGSAIASEAIQQGCVQELAVFVAPKLLGGIKSMAPLDDFGFTSMNQVIEMGNFSMEKFGQDLLLRMPFLGGKP